MIAGSVLLRRGLVSLGVVGALVLAPTAALATGDNGGQSAIPPSAVFGPTGTAVPGDIHVALFFDPNFVDTATDGDGEAFNLQQTLISQGFDVATFTGTTTAEWTAALTGADVVAIPELEEDDGLGTALEPGALAALQAFLNAGGRMTTYVDSAFGFMETVLGLSAGTLTGDESCPCTKTAAAAGTEWADGPTALADNNATDTLDITTAPAGSLAIYADDDDADEAGLALIPIGSGSIVYFGWDWFFDEDETDQFQPWFDVLAEAMVQTAPVTPPVEPPTTPPTQPAPAPLVVTPRFTG
jgi:hypothetical protein